ncbi:hypothetical protein F4703DRAFT_1481134 [Phycomyces blakesleeanus]
MKISFIFTFFFILNKLTARHLQYQKIHCIFKYREKDINSKAEAQPSCQILSGIQFCLYPTSLFAILIYKLLLLILIYLLI